MRKDKVAVVFSLLALSFLFFPGCTSKGPSTGSLTITVINYKTGLPVANELVYLATSYDNLKINQVYVTMGYTDTKGQIMFHDLNPVMMYYDTQTWENYGATQVYAGIDMLAILFVNNDTLKMNKLRV
jgi:uncharacterized membrane protein